MVRGRISPKTKERFRKSIRDVIQGLSRKVQVYKQPIKLECPNCYFDKLTSKSTGKCRWSVSEAEAMQAQHILTNPGEIRYQYFRVGRCPICKGDGFLEIRRRAWADCLVIWDSGNRYSNDTVYTPAGTEGSTVLQLKTDPKYLNLFKNCQSVFVDGIECKLSKPPVLRGLGNQSVLTVTLFTTDKPKIDSGEIIKDYT